MRSYLKQLIGLEGVGWEYQEREGKKGVGEIRESMENEGF
jgi:hypothetical protein